MKLFICSDIHSEFFGGLSNTTESLDIFPEADGIIVSGDLTTKSYILNDLKFLCDKYRYVIYVTGNHEFYNSSFPEIEDILSKVPYKNLYWLNDSICNIEGINFVGGTLWFNDDPLNQIYEKRLNDFSRIQDFRREVYIRNQKTIKFFDTCHIDNKTVVITHHLPSYESVNEKYIGDGLNRFFVSELESLITSKQPRIWIHGHSHDSSDYQIKNTRILCNPLGYPHERNRNFRKDLIIDLS